MKEELKVTLVQSDIIWQKAEENLKRYTEQIAQLKRQTDLIILPEMFTTGFSMSAPELAESMDGPTVNWMIKQASSLGAATCGSLIIEENGRYYNRFVFAYPDGRLTTYDKRHLFAMAGEHEVYTAGAERRVLEYLGWRICPLICYDLRFPVWARNNQAYDLLIYVANWPDRRAYDWQIQLRSRAIENQCYVAAVNRVGTDGNGLDYKGNSCVIDPGWRHTLTEMSYVEGVQTASLSAGHLKEVREKLPFLKDQGKFELQ
ncbi:MAG: amidohydrolase [Bacteroidota bacterium]